VRVGELARRTGATIRALRNYEAAGLVVPARLPNGYRDYAPVAVRQVEEIRALHDLGLSVQETRPFVECLADGHLAGDECPQSPAAYRRRDTTQLRGDKSIVRRPCRRTSHISESPMMGLSSPAG
jgi:DNA-binding transcriptional MerR regulator